MSDTAARLQAYKDAELRILQAQSIRDGNTERRNAELSEIRKAIKELEAQLAAEGAAAAGRIGPAIAVADFSRPLQ